MAAKLRLFIGSSTEALDYANAIQENLDHDADCTVWQQGVFGLSRTVFASLLNSLDNYDCAVFVFAPDDKLTLRGENKLAVRDNVLFELGLFVGRFGVERVFVAIPRNSERLRIISDLAGVVFAPYQVNRPDNNIVAALGTACNQIRRELRALATSGNHRVIAVTRRGFFSEFTTTFLALLRNATDIVLYFIHSRRWRENHNDQIIEFLKKKDTHLEVFLPNRKNKTLMKAIQQHFDDGPHIPGFVSDAFEYFENLQKRFSKKVFIRTFDTYPTYSLYKFDDQLVIAAYPTTPRRRDVPTIQVCSTHPFAQFVLEDLMELRKKAQKRRQPVTEH